MVEGNAVLPGRAGPTRPLTDNVQVMPAVASNTTISAQYWVSAADQAKASSIQAAVAQAVDDYKAWQTEQIGRAINPDELRKRMLNAERHRFWKIREILKPQYMWFASRKKQYILRFSKIIFLFLPLICEEYGTAFRKFFRYSSCGKSQKQEVKFPVIFLKHSFFTAVNILSLLPV